MSTGCPACGGPQRKNGFGASSGGGRYQRMKCKACGKTEYISLEGRVVLAWSKVVEMAQTGRLRVWVDGKVHNVERI